jgi:hypothetical protein
MYDPEKLKCSGIPYLPFGISGELVLFLELDDLNWSLTSFGRSSPFIVEILLKVNNHTTRNLKFPQLPHPSSFSKHLTTTRNYVRVRKPTPPPIFYRYPSVEKIDTFFHKISPIYFSHFSILFFHLKNF